jgi:hypothetical protein
MSSKATVFRCDVCSTSLTRKSDLDRHIRNRHGSAAFFCPVRSCKRSTRGKGFARKENLNAHCRRLHPFINKFNRPELLSCSYCENVDSLDQVNEKDPADIESQETEDRARSRSSSITEDHSQILDNTPKDSSITISLQEYNDLRRQISELETQIIQLNQQKGLDQDNIRHLIQLLSTRS